jgi:3-hexulose-6-phosphate synthase/6-phospho-3-hexuloisomerase
MTARKYGAEVMLDLINVPDKVKRAKEAEKMGVSYICLHMGIDEQMKGEEPPIEILKTLAKETSIPIAVAGGITAENAGDYVAAGASIVIVGGGIYKTGNVVEAAKNVKNSMLGKEITLTLNDRAFQFYDVAAKDWRSEPGRFNFLIGNSSKNILQTLAYDLK